MRVCIVGSGYVGLVSGAGFAEMGNTVVCADVDDAKVQRLRRGELPIFEPGLDELVERNVKQGRLSFTSDVEAAIGAAEVIFVAVGTPMRSDGAADLTAVDRVAETVGRCAQQDAVLVMKSTVPVGTNARARRILAESGKRVHVVSNPEFLKEGDAVNDFLRPDRIVVGADEGHARDLMKRLYHPLCLDRDRMIWMDPASAELTKYVANTMLAMRISFMNEIAALCEKVGADVHQVRVGAGSDARIGGKFLYAGPGYGGSCLAGRETVLVRRNERVSLVSLQALFDAQAPEAGDDPTPRAASAAGVDVLAWSPSTRRAELHPVSVVTRRAFEGEVVELLTKMGRRVRCTPDHPFVTYDAEGRARGVKLASELTTDDWLPLAMGEVAGSVPAEIDLLEVLGATGVERSEVIARLGAAERSQLEAMGLDEVTRRLAPLGHLRGRERARDVMRAGALRLEEASALGLALEHATFGTAKNGTYLPRRIPMDRDFWYVLGLYLAEGHCTTDGQRQRLSWSFHPRDEEHLVAAISSFWERLDVKHDVRNGSTTRQVTVSSRLLAGLFLNVLGTGGDCYSHRIPDLAWGLPAEHRWALLAGLFHGDGSWSVVGGGPSVVIEYGTVSRELADGMLRLLGTVGVPARWKIGRSAKSTRDAHFLVISGADRVEAAIELVDRLDRDEVRSSVRKQTKRIAPTGFRPLGESMIVRIAKIERRPWQGFVYSLEVPGPETIVTTGGLVVHNCFPKDVKALVHTGREHGVELELAATTDRVNQRQKGILFRKLKAHFDGDLRNKVIAVWGIAFKPRTDDIRESPALSLIDALIAEGAKVTAHDPEARDAARALYGEKIRIVDDAYEAAAGADALVLVTEWRQYQSPDFLKLKETMRGKMILDGRNIWSTYGLRGQGFTYDAIGVRGS